MGKLSRRGDAFLHPSAAQLGPVLQGPCLAASAGEFLLRVSSSCVAEHSLNPSTSNLRIKPVLFTPCLPAFLAFTPFCFLGQKIHYLRCCFTFGNPDISLARVSRASARPPSSSSGAGKHLKCFFALRPKGTTTQLSFLIPVRASTWLRAQKRHRTPTPAPLNSTRSFVVCLQRLL